MKRKIEDLHEAMILNHDKQIANLNKMVELLKSMIEKVDAKHSLPKNGQNN